MNKFKANLILAIVAITSVAFTLKSDDFGYKVGDNIEDFKLKNIDDKMVSLSDYKDAKGLLAGKKIDKTETRAIGCSIKVK